MENLKISEIEQFHDLSELIELTCNATAQRAEKFLIGFQVEMDVTVVNKNGDKKDFHLVFQNEDRSLRIMSYSNYGMSASAVYGCGADETPELEKWLSETEEYDFAQSVISRCESIADDLAEVKYLAMLEEFEESENE
jgi:hypothetical protein